MAKIQKPGIIAILGTLIILITLGATVIGVDERYAKETEVVKTLQQFQTEQNKNQTLYELKSDYRFYEFTYNSLTTEIFKYKKLIRENPNDQELKLEYNDLINQRNEVKKKMLEIMEKIK